MTQPPIAENRRSYGCTFGCGNPYDMIVISVADGTTEFLCMPCFITLASNALEAITNSANPAVEQAMAEFSANGPQSVPGPSGKRGRRNAPATSENDDLIESYEDIIDAEDLPEAFR